LLPNIAVLLLHICTAKGINELASTSPIIFSNNLKSKAMSNNTATETASGTVHYKKNGIAIFPASIDDVFGYMSEGNHHHAAFKSHELSGMKGNVVTLNAEIFNPDGSTFKTKITHRFDRPRGIETTMTGGAFSGARFTHSYTETEGMTKVDVEGDFPTFPAMSAADELKIIDEFFTMVFAEDTATLKSRSLAALS
jgi:hypothetical protein